MSSGASSASSADAQPPPSTFRQPGITNDAILDLGVPAIKHDNLLHLATTMTNHEIIDRLEALGKVSKETFKDFTLQNRLSAALERRARNEGRTKARLQEELQAIRVANGTERRKHQAGGAKAHRTKTAKAARDATRGFSPSAFPSASSSVAGEVRAVGSGEAGEKRKGSRMRASVSTDPASASSSTSSNIAALPDSSGATAKGFSRTRSNRGTRIADFEQQLRRYEIQAMFTDDDRVFDDEVLEVARAHNNVEIAELIDLPTVDADVVQARIAKAVRNEAERKRVSSNFVRMLLLEARVENGVLTSTGRSIVK